MRPGSLEYFLATLSGGAGLLSITGAATIFNIASEPFMVAAPASVGLLNFGIAAFFILKGNKKRLEYNQGNDPTP